MTGFFGAPSEPNPARTPSAPLMLPNAEKPKQPLKEENTKPRKKDAWNSSPETETVMIANERSTAPEGFHRSGCTCRDLALSPQLPRKFQSE